MMLFNAGDLAPRFERPASIASGVRRLLTWKVSAGSLYPWLEPPGRLFIDSNAYSAFTQGTAISLDQYIAFCHKYKDRLFTYANLDVIGDAQRSNDNLAAMRSADLNPLPVYHNGSPTRDLETMLEENTFIALGGLVPLSPPLLREHLRKCFVVVRKHWPKKVHLLGVLNRQVLAQYPVFSADSSSAIYSGGVGVRITFAHGVLKRTSNFYGRRKTSRQYGCDHLRLNNMKAVAQYETYLTNLWRSRGITF